ncbi:expressed unknown protein [Seminavis robusta]|uniref:Uncharacterized protein n=1 Tax=Seminavis robusta TaxID=568900 RepID=A0A9N8DJV4_9STRA|nr:expressed unknown protein [Seminavis robusta]|eukprot:Sro123_g059550.1 n/a (157) ;mRNA; f:56667-57230
MRLGTILLPFFLLVLVDATSVVESFFDRGLQSSSNGTEEEGGMMMLGSNMHDATLPPESNTTDAPAEPESPGFTIDVSETGPPLDTSATLATDPPAPEATDAPQASPSATDAPVESPSPQVDAEEPTPSPDSGTTAVLSTTGRYYATKMVLFLVLG